MKDSPDPTDEALFAAYRDRGDDAAIATLIERRWSTSYRIAHTVLRDPAGAEDAAQDAFVRLMEMAHTQKEIENVGAWLRRVVVNQALTSARSEKRRAKREETVGSARRKRASATKDPGAALREFTESLPEKLRLPLELHFGFGFTHAEVGVAMGCPAGTASSRIRTGLEKLRTRLAGVGQTLAVPAVGSLLTASLADTAEAAPAAPAPAALRARAKAPATGVAPLLPKLAAISLVSAIVLGPLLWAAYGSGAGEGTDPVALNQPGDREDGTAGTPPAEEAGPQDPARTEAKAPTQDSTTDAAPKSPVGASGDSQPDSTDAPRGAPQLVVRVRDAQGNPIADAEVQILHDRMFEARGREDLDPEEWSWFPHDRPGWVRKLRHTDATGTLEVRGSSLKPGNAVFVWARDIHSLVWRVGRSARVHVGSPGETESEVVVVPLNQPREGRGAVSGTVTLAGEPAVNAQLWGAIRLDDGTGFDGQDAWMGTRCDARGRFAISNLPTGTYEFRLAPKSYAGVPHSFVVREGQVTRVQLDYRVKQGVLQGALALHPRASADKVWLRLEKDGVTRRASGKSGGYRFWGLDAGDYMLRVFHDGFADRHYRVSVPGPGEHAGPTIDLARDRRVVGRLVDRSGAALADEGIEVRELGGYAASDFEETEVLDDPRAAARLESGSDGSFEILLPPGRYGLFVSESEIPGAFRSRKEVTEFTVEADDVDLGDLDTKRTAGTCQLEGLVLAPDGAPARDATVEVKRLGQRHHDLPLWISCDDATGRFSLSKALTPGRYVVQAKRHMGSLVAPLQVLELRAGETTNATFQLGEPGVLRVELGDHLSTEVSVGGHGPLGAFASGSRTSKPGEPVEFTLPPGRYRVRVESLVEPYEVELRAGEVTRIAPTFERAHGTVNVRCQLWDGTPVERGRLAKVTWGSPRQVRVAEFEDGVARIRGVGEGAGVVEVEAKVPVGQPRQVQMGRETVMLRSYQDWTYRSPATLQDGETVLVRFPDSGVVGTVTGRFTVDEKSSMTRVFAFGENLDVQHHCGGNGFSLELPPGRYTVVVVTFGSSWASDYQPDPSQGVTVEISAGRTVDAGAVRVQQAR